jgi:hypothetical protein
MVIVRLLGSPWNGNAVLHAFEIIFSVGSIFIASVTVEVFKMDREKNLVVTENCYPLTNLVTAISTQNALTSCGMHLVTP